MENVFIVIIVIIGLILGVTLLYICIDYNKYTNKILRPALKNSKYLINYRNDLGFEINDFRRYFDSNLEYNVIITSDSIFSCKVNDLIFDISSILVEAVDITGSEIIFDGVAAKLDKSFVKNIDNLSNKDNIYYDSELDYYYVFISDIELDVFGKNEDISSVFDERVLAIYNKVTQEM